MWPILLQIGVVTIYSYGLFLAIAFLTGTFFVWQQARKRGFDEEKVMDFIILFLLGALLCGRVIFVLSNLDLFRENWMLVFQIWERGGFSPFGLLFGGGLTGWWYLKRQHWPVWMSFDLLCLGLVLAQVIERVGLFFGNGYLGSQTSFFLGLISPNETIKRHPVALYEAFFYLLTFFFLWYLFQTQSKKEKGQTGLVINFYLVAIALQTFVFSLLRVYDKVVDLNLTFIYSSIIMVVSLFVWYLRQEREIKVDLAYLSQFIKKFQSSGLKGKGMGELVEKAKKIKPKKENNDVKK